MDIKKIKKAVVVMLGILITLVLINNSITDFEESKGDIISKIGEEVNGATLTINEYIMLCEKTIGIYLSAAKSGDFLTTYALLTPEYREVVDYDTYVESVKDIDFAYANIGEIDVLTTSLYQANVAYSGESNTQEYLILLEDNGFSIIPDKFLMYEEYNKTIKKKNVVYELISCEIYLDTCIFNCNVTNNRKEDIVISNAKMYTEEGVRIEASIDYTIAPGETKLISIPIEHEFAKPAIFEITRETEDRYMQYQFEL